MLKRKRMAVTIDSGKMKKNSKTLVQKMSREKQIRQIARIARLSYSETARFPDQV